MAILCAILTYLVQACKLNKTCDRSVGSRHRRKRPRLDLTAQVPCGGAGAEEGRGRETGRGDTLGEAAGDG